MESQQHKPWHAMSYEDVERVLDTSEKGLSDAEAAKRLAEYGRNNLREKKPKSIWKMIWEQITDVMVLILIAAAVFSFVMSFFEEGEGLAECIVILVVIVVSYCTQAPSEEKIKGLVFGTASKEQLAETRASWNKSFLLVSRKQEKLYFGSRNHRLCKFSLT